MFHAVSTVKQDFSQPQQPLWDFPILPQLAQAASPLDLAPQPVSRPLFTSYDQPQSADAGATAPAASQAPQPKKMQHTASSSSSDSKEDQEISKLQERIHKQKEKNARNQREFRRRVIVYAAPFPLMTGNASCQSSMQHISFNAFCSCRAIKPLNS